MAKEFSRSQRVAEQIMRELAELIRLEVKDPRVALRSQRQGAGLTPARVFRLVATCCQPFC